MRKSHLHTRSLSTPSTSPGKMLQNKCIIASGTTFEKRECHVITLA